jgi:hypothetical protein
MKALGVPPSLKVTLFLFIIAGAVGCSDNVLDEVDSPQEVSPSARMLDPLLVDPQSIGFQQVKQLVFEDNCLSCHNSLEAAGGIDLSQFVALRESQVPNLLMSGEPFESRLYTSLLAEAGPLQMPPPDLHPLSDEQKQLVFLWIARGAPEHPSAPESLQSLPAALDPYFQSPETIDYSVVRQWVFEPGRCYECHSRQGRRPDQQAIVFGADMTRHSDLFLNNAVVPGQPQHTRDSETGEVQRYGSHLYEAVANEQTMPPPEEGFRPLSDLRVRLLRLWILNCAIDSRPDLKQDALIDNPENPEKVRHCL